MAVQESTGDAILFRYDVKPKGKVSVFEVNVPDGNPLNMRATMLGGLAKSNLHKLAKSAMGSILWEVPCHDMTVIKTHNDMP